MLFVLLFAFYPILDSALDAYSDHLTHPLRMTPDDRMCSARNNHYAQKMTALFQRVSILQIDEMVFYFSGKRAIPVTAIKTSQSCFPASSDLSPPVI